jgi:hypothetical protein
MTEQQAKEKWCPMVWHSEDDVMPAANRWVFGNKGRDERVNCIASNCMMWRWIDENERGLTEDDGYCGLGGQP